MSRNLIVRLGLLAAWAGLVLWMTANHVYWRDEVRALTLALSGDSWAEFWGAVQGDHPYLWYILLRLTHGVIGRPEALGVAAFAVAAASALLFVTRAPFPPFLIALILFSQFFVYEYTVMARNYGIGMLIMFGFAALYEEHKDSGWALGLLLFLLVNTNVQAAALGLALFAFWFLDILNAEGLRWTPKLQNVLVQGAVTFCGLVVCFLSVYPSRNDLVLPDTWGAIASPGTWTTAVLLPLRYLGSLFDNVLGFPWDLARDWPSAVAGSLLLFGSALGLARRPAALAIAVLGIIGSAVLARIFEAYSVRHVSQLVAFLVALHWIAWRTEPDTGMLKVPRAGLLRPWGIAAFILMFIVLVAEAVVDVRTALFGPPQSSSRAVAEYVSADPALNDAIIVAEPDPMVEPLAYYLPNQTYLMRSEGFGAYVPFTRNARLNLSLDDIVATACDLRTRHARPVILLLRPNLDAITASGSVGAGYEWTLSGSAEQVVRFRAASRLLKRFDQAHGDENYDAYQMTCGEQAPTNAPGTRQNQ